MAQDDHTDDPLAAARAAWPGLDVAADRYDAHLARHGVGPGSVPATVASDLYLALACASHQPDALAILDLRYIATLDATLARFGMDRATIDEAKQLVRERLLIAAAGDAPRIASFAGRGSLSAWIRATASRIALNLLRDRRGAPVTDDAVLAGAVDGAPGLDHGVVIRRHRRQIDAALAAAMAALSPADRLLVRQHYLDGASFVELGALHRAHPVTMQRRVVRIHHVVLRAVTARLEREIGLAGDELASLIRQVRSGLHVSLLASASSQPDELPPASDP